MGSMNSTGAGAGAGTGTGTTGPISSSTAYNGGYDPYNQGQYQYQQPHQHQQHQYQQPQQYPYYDHAAAYNYRNPYGETHPSSYGYQWPTSVGVTVANTNTNTNAANHTSYYEGGYGERRGSQQHSNEYEFIAHVHAHAPVTA